MNRTFLELSQLTNRALLARVDELVRRERRVQAALIANLSELDARKLYLDAGCASFYVYCVEKLGYSASAAYRRMEAARAARRFPVILERLVEGGMNLTTVALVGKHLTAANYREVLAAAAGKSQREVEALVARMRGIEAAPQRSTVRVVQVAAPATAPPGGAAARSAPASPRDLTNSTSAGGSDCAETAPRADMPLVGDVAGPPTAAPPTVLAYRHAITLTAEEQADLDRARELLRHAVPNGDPARIVGRALRQLVATLEARKFGAVRKPRAVKKRRAAQVALPSVPRTADVPQSRAIPAAVRREVTVRDAGQCTFVSARGHRCTDRGALEFHHRMPFAKDGPTTPDNLTLLCARHHRQESERTFGPARKFAATRITSAGGSGSIGPPHPLRE